MALLEHLTGDERIHKAGIAKWCVILLFECLPFSLRIPSHGLLEDWALMVALASCLAGIQIVPDLLHLAWFVHVLPSDVLLILNVADCLPDCAVALEARAKADLRIHIRHG
jgi:hypothetical protein